MSVDLNMGVVGYVAVHAINGKELYRASAHSRTEIDAWIEAHRASVAGWGCLKSSFAPVRVDHWGDLKKDLFLPTFVNLVLKINNRCLLIFAAIFLGVLWYTWPDPPWLSLQIVGVTVMILAPFLFYPFSKTLFLAFDLAFRPASHDELV